MEILSLVKNLISNLEIQSGFMFSICRALIALLSMGHFFLEELVELIEVYSIIPGTGGREVTFQMDGNVWMIALIGEDG
jgi:hypothetical protein